MRPLHLCILGLLLLAGCGAPAVQRPTLPPVINLTPAPTQDVDGTATAFAILAQPTPTLPGQYVIREGDTLESVASAFNTTVEELAATNSISDVNTIYVGQSLIIPSKADASAIISPTLELESDQSPTSSP